MGCNEYAAEITNPSTKNIEDDDGWNQTSANSIDTDDTRGDMPRLKPFYYTDDLFISIRTLCSMYTDRSTGIYTHSKSNVNKRSGKYTFVICWFFLCVWFLVRTGTVASSFVADAGNWQ